MTGEGKIYRPDLTGPSDAEVSAAEAVLLARKEALGLQAKDTLLECGSFHNFPYPKGCGVRSAVKDVEYVQTHFYISPHGCSGGDYWRQGEGQWVCPACGTRNRLMNSSQDERNKPVVEMKRHFRCLTEAHDDR